MKNWIKILAAAFAFSGTGLAGGAASAAEFEVLDRLSVDGYAVLRGSADVSGSGFSVGGSTFVVKTGNVGIGTTDPGALFQVGGGTLTATAGGYVGIGQANPANVLHVTGNVEDALVRLHDNSATFNQTTVRFRAQSPANANAHADFGFKATGSEAGRFFFKAPYNSAERMVIDTAGNVGIGTTSPAAIFDVGGTAAIKIPVGTTLERPASPSNGMLRVNTTTGRLEYYNSGWNSIGAVVATGGNTVADSGGYRVHTFTGNGTFSVTSGGNIEVLVVAGGGGGAGGSPSNDGNGGGGAGGFLETTLDIVTGSYAVTVGAGGSGGAASAASPGGDGGSSIFSTLTAIGGGGGGSDTGTNNGRAGGSGGGASCSATGGTGGSAASGQGYAGGNAGAGGGPGGGGGGGGGASAAGGTGGQSIAGGVGGAGRASSISGSSTLYAGGGGGSSWTSSGGTGGTGGGGRGGSRTGAYSGIAGSVNTGGGGGAGTGGYASGGGGSGIVIIRYPK